MEPRKVPAAMVTTKMTIMIPLAVMTAMLANTENTVEGTAPGHGIDDVPLAPLETTSTTVTARMGDILNMVVDPVRSQGAQLGWKLFLSPTLLQYVCRL